MHGVTRVLREAALWVTAVLGSISVLAAVGAVAFGITPLIFRSGSMSPDIPTGSLGIAQRTDAADIQAGDIVSVVWSDDTRVTHRVVAIERRDGGFVQLETKGDANSAVDTEHPLVDHVDRMLFSLPGAGYVLQEITKPYWVFGSGVVVGAIVMLSLIRPRDRKDDDEPTEDQVEIVERPLLAANWPPVGRGEPAGTTDLPMRHVGPAAHGRHGRTSAGILASAVLLVSLALVPAPVGTLASFSDPGAATATYVTGTVPPVASVGCSITGTLAKSVVLTWPAATGGLGPITSYRVSGPGVDQVVSGLTVTIPPGLLSHRHADLHRAEPLRHHPVALHRRQPPGDRRHIAHRQLRVTSAADCRAISSSSSVGITSTAASESSGEIADACWSLSSGTMRSPRNSRPCTTRARILASCSPTPAVNTRASMPPRWAAYPPTYCRMRWAYTSRASSAA